MNLRSWALGPKRLAYASMDRLVRARGYELIAADDECPPAGWTCLNVGSGGQEFPGFTNLDVPSEHYDASRSGPFVEYDMREGPLPYADSSVDLIYCSHVIEHVEDEHATRFVHESARVLRPGGVLRIACPDAAFLWQVSAFENTYWTWRWPLMRKSGIDPESLAQRDFLLREVCTPKFRQRLAEPGADPVSETEWLEDSSEIGRRLDELTSEMSWDREQIGQHINWWSFNKVAAVAAGQFRYTIRSRYRGSASQYMRTRGFDLTCPEMSLYVDCIK